MSRRPARGGVVAEGATRQPTHDWEAVLGELLERPGRVRPHFQPIVDLRRGEVCGYEALARFGDRPGLAPADVFAAAMHFGVHGALEAQTIRAVLDARPHVDGSHFVSVNLSPHAALAPEVRETFDRAGRLDGVLVEITEQTDADLDDLAAVLAEVRARGALVAVDDAGSGYGSLGRITALHPHFVKIDRELVHDVDDEPAKAAVVETLAELASRIDAWVVAEGIERLEELDAVIRMRVPLGQGFALGRPAAAIAGLDRELAERIRSRRRPDAHGAHLGPLLEAVPTLPEPVSPQALGVLFDRSAAPQFIALVDADGRPSGIVRQEGHERDEPAVRALMLVTRDMPLGPVGRRAMARPAARRFDPLVCCDESGRYVGLIRVERLVDALAAQATPGGAP